MARKILIQVRRGLEKDIGTLSVAELGFCTDTAKLYIGTTSGNVLLVAAQTVGDMLKSIYDTNNDGVVDRADIADSVQWNNVTNKPTSFAPSAHTHSKAEIGLGNVANYGLATQLEAETGVSNTKYMTPFLTKKAIDKANEGFTWGKLAGGFTWQQLKGGV